MRISDWSSDGCSSDLVRRIAGADILLVGQVLHVQLQAPVAEVVVGGGVEQGVRRRLPLVGHVAEMLADVAHARAEAQSRQRAAGDGVEIGRASCRERVCQYV